MMTSKLIERIEGEAVVDFELGDAGQVDFATIRFPHIRGMEKILRGRGGMDALVVTPRVCGICGHSHLMATVGALEAVYAAAGEPVALSEKARSIREMTLMLELVQNHFKWFYLVIMPELARLRGEASAKPTALKGAFAASVVNKALALLAGQWPHSSYAVPGGVTCDPTAVEIHRALSHVDEAIRFFEKEFAGMGFDHFLVMKSCKEFDGIDSDVTQVERWLIEHGLHETGSSFDRFMVLGDHSYAVPGKLMGTIPRKVDIASAGIREPFAPLGKSEAFNAHYNGQYYETGPLARAMSMGYPLIKNMHRRFKDSAYSRVMARVYETAQLLYRIRHQLASLPLDQPSYSEPDATMKTLSGRGEFAVEAPRGPLIHRVELKEGIISDYAMITPTQWNLGSGTKEVPGVAQQAMTGVKDTDTASFVFRTFDVCSVCTTH
jgi:Ni,Fe-hydrogenase I large subunit